MIEEPGAGILHAGICAGGAGQPAFLPRQTTREAVPVNKRERDKPMSRVSVLLFLVALVAFGVIRFLEGNGRDLGIFGTVASWLSGIVMLVTFLEPFFWLARVARGGSPWDR